MNVNIRALGDGTGNRHESDEQTRADLVAVILMVSLALCLFVLGAGVQLGAEFAVDRASGWVSEIARSLPPMPGTPR